jgi:hypothetical protein
MTGKPFNNIVMPQEKPSVSISKPSIDELWRRLKSFEGDEFETKTRKPFTYKISGDVFHPSPTEYNISKAEFRKALALVPFDGPGVINRDVRGPAYVWAVFHDKRIRKQNW